MKFKYFVIFALIYATLVEPNVASAAPQVKVSVISGTRGANSAEECENLYDGNIYTKWCVTHFLQHIRFLSFQRLLRLTA